MSNKHQDHKHTTSMPRFLISVSLYVIPYVAFLMVMIVWLTSADSFDRQKAGSLLQFLGIVLGVSIFLEDQLNDAEMFLRKKINLLIQQETFKKGFFWAKNKLYKLIETSQTRLTVTRSIATDLANWLTSIISNLDYGTVLGIGGVSSIILSVYLTISKTIPPFFAQCSEAVIQANFLNFSHLKAQPNCIFLLLINENIYSTIIVIVSVLALYVYFHTDGVIWRFIAGLFALPIIFPVVGLTLGIISVILGGIIAVAALAVAGIVTVTFFTLIGIFYILLQFFLSSISMIMLALLFSFGLAIVVVLLLPYRLLDRIVVRANKNLNRQKVTMMIVIIFFLELFGGLLELL